MKLTISQEGANPIEISLEGFFGFGNNLNKKRYRFLKRWIGTKNVVLLGQMSSTYYTDDWYWYTDRYENKKRNDDYYSEIYSSKYSLLVNEIEDYLSKPVFLPKKDVENLKEILNDFESKGQCPGIENGDAKDLVRIGFINGDNSKPLYYIDNVLNNDPLPVFYRPDTNQIISNLWYEKYEEYSEDFEIKKNIVVDQLSEIALACYCNPLKSDKSNNNNFGLIGDILYECLDNNVINALKKERLLIEKQSDKINGIIHDCLYKHNKTDIISKFNKLISNTIIKDEIQYFYAVNNNETYDIDELRKNHSLVPAGTNFGISSYSYINNGDFECYVRVNPVFKNKYNTNKMRFYIFLEFKSWKLKNLDVDILVKE